MKDAIVVYLRDGEIHWSPIYPSYNITKYLIKNFSKNSILTYYNLRVDILFCREFLKINFLTPEAMEYLKK